MANTCSDQSKILKSAWECPSDAQIIQVIKDHKKIFELMVLEAPFLKKLPFESENMLPHVGMDQIDTIFGGDEHPEIHRDEIHIYIITLQYLFHSQCLSGW